MNDPIIPTIEDFHNALTMNGYPVPHNLDQLYKAFVDSVGFVRSKFAGAFISSFREMAMFLAQVFHESGGLRYTEEIGCPTTYVTGKEPPGLLYYGRGYIQLTWIYNYEQCSQDLYGNDRLVNNPNLVAENQNECWRSALWYWSRHVHNRTGVTDGHFNETTLAINPMEKNEEHREKREHRFAIYGKVLQAFRIFETPIQ